MTAKRLTGSNQYPNGVASLDNIEAEAVSPGG